MDQKLKKIKDSKKNFFIKTFGCQMNEYDSKRIVDILKKFGFQEKKDLESLDCFILNTCHIREKATEKVYHEIGRLKKKYKYQKKPIVLVTGCVAQAENDEMLKRENYIDAVIGPQSYQNIPKVLDQINKNKKSLNFTEFDVIDKFDKLNKLVNLNSKISSFITIQEGCDKFCSFCVVPYTRGSEYSRSIDEIIYEASSLIKNGSREITLLGQNVNAYKYISNNRKFKLSDLIKELDKLKDLKRIRYTTSHPNDMTEDLIECYKYSKKLMPFIHLPVQSGSNKILKKMNRKYTVEKYLSIVKELRNILPKMEFSSDFIVGFPGETDKDFNDTLNLIKDVKFINSYSFVYNKRPGTPAARLASIDPKLQKTRLSILQNLIEKIQIEKNHKSIGTSKEVLVENRMKDQSKYFGRSCELTPVIFDANDHDIGQIINVEIKDFNRNSLFGKKISIKKEDAA